MVLRDGQAVVGHCGALPDPIQSSPRAELWAALQVLKVVMPPVALHVDHLVLAQGIEEGPEWASAPPRPNRDVWLQIWEKTDDLGGIGPVRFLHAAGHQAGSGVHKKGNEWAGTVASLGIRQTLESVL